MLGLPLCQPIGFPNCDELGNQLGLQEGTPLESLAAGQVWIHQSTELVSLSGFKPSQAAQPHEMMDIDWSWESDSQLRKPSETAIKQI